MKKTAKITCITIASVLGTAALLSCTVGGIPCRRYAEKHYQNVDNAAKVYPYAGLQAPDDWQTYTGAGIRLLVPKGTQQLGYDESSVKVLSKGSENSDDYCFMEFFTHSREKPESEFPELVGMAEWYGTQTWRQKAMTLLICDYAKQHGKSVDDWYSFYDLVNSLRLEDCNFHSLKNGIAFDALAAYKEHSTFFQDDVWERHTDQSDGFISQIPVPKSGSEAQHWILSVTLFPKQNRNQELLLYLITADTESAIKIINSIQFTEA